MRKRFHFALAAYAALGLLAWLTLEDELLWVVLVVLLGFALKSWLHVKREELGD